MSYILDALKRSQQQRELGQTPTLHDPPRASGAPAPRRASWPVATGLLAVAAVALALYAVLQVRAPTPARVAGAGDAVASAAPADAAPRAEPVVAPSAAVAVATPATPPAPPPPAARVTAPPAPQPATATPPLAAPAAPQTALSGLDLPDDLPPEVAAELAAELAALQALVERDRADAPVPPAQAAPPAPAASAAPAALPAFAELPLGLRQRIPELRVSVQVYDADPARRFVIVDSRRLGEGASTPQGLLLREIRQDGLVLEFEGRRFFRPR